MARFYGKTNKFVRHVPAAVDYVCEPQRAMHVPFWYHEGDYAGDSDGDDVQTIGMKAGSIVKNHHVDMTITPETNDPQNVYIGILKLSFHDVLAPEVCGIFPLMGEYADATPTMTTKTGYLNVYPGGSATDFQVVPVTGQLDVQQEDLMLDDNVFHFLSRLKKVTVFNQQPLVASRFMKIPSKVKRINPWTYYGMVIFNDAPRGGTPADTQVTLHFKQRFEEWQI